MSLRRVGHRLIGVAWVQSGLLSTIGAQRRQRRSPGWLPHQLSGTWIELEDAAIPGDLGRVVQVDAVDETDEHEAKWDASGVRCEDVAEELDSLRRVGDRKSG